MQKPLAGKTVAVLLASGFDELQMTEAQKALLKLGATVHLIGPESLVNGWHGNAWGHYFPTDAAIGTMLSADYDMLLVPGGARSLLKLAQTPHTRRVVSAFIDDKKPVALIGEGIEVLAIAERAQGVTVSGSSDSRVAIEAAGGVWSDDALTLSNGHILTALGEDMPAFMEEMTNLFLGQEPVRDAA